MRTIRFTLVAFFALLPLTAAAQQPTDAGAPAQTPPATGAQAPGTTVQATTPPPDYVPAPKNLIDFGARYTSVDGDAARYERFRDLSSGLFLQRLRLSREHDGWLFDVAGDNVGRDDQRLGGSAGKPGYFKIWGLWDRIPMTMSNTTQTLYVEDTSTQPKVLTIPDAIQSAVQADVNALPGLFDANAITFETKTLRQIGTAGFDYMARPDFTLKTRLDVTTRTGSLPFGGSFGHSTLVEMPAPVDNRLTDFSTNGEFARQSALFRAGVTGSWFHNNATDVTFDNPFRVADAADTPSSGRSSLAPSNSLIGVNGMASFKLPGHSRATAYGSVGSLKDAGDPIMPQTTNTVNLPLITPLPRTTVNGEAMTSSMNFTFVSRPSQNVDVEARYRFYDYDNQTPVFVMPQRVSYDNSPKVPTFSTLGGDTSPLTVETEPFGIKRGTFDADLRFHPAKGAFGVGYSLLTEDRTYRILTSTNENVLRLTYDVVGTGPFSLRTKYEHGTKSGDVTDEAQLDLFNIGEHPEMRQYDVASRDRDRGTILGSVAKGTMALSGSIAAGKDDYTQSTFGLRDNTYQIYGTAIDISRSEHTSYGGSYSYERYTALLRSRQADGPSSVVTYDQYLQLAAQPSSDVQIADARRNWGNEGADRVHAVLAHADFLGLREEKLDLHFSFDYNRSRSAYTYTTGPDVPRTLPDEVPPPASTLPPPTPLPLVKSDLTRGTFDMMYALTHRLGIGFTYWYEDFKVDDWTLDADANSDLTGKVVLLGYMYRPYTAFTVFGRLVYRW